MSGRITSNWLEAYLTEAVRKELCTKIARVALRCAVGRYLSNGRKLTASLHASSPVLFLIGGTRRRRAR